MRRVFTDERFPGCEIVNDGSLVFQVYFEGRLLQSFETWENAETGIKRPNDPQVSDAFAARRAQEYFDRWAKMDQEQNSDVIHDVPIPEPGREGPPPENITKTIDDLMAKERQTVDPAQKSALRRQIMHLMQREESVAAAVVSSLIY